MKPEAELKELMQQWENDPCWDIEETEGFEFYKEFLKNYRLNKEAEWKKEIDEKYHKVALALGCSSMLAKYIYSLEERIKTLEEKIK